MARKAKDISMVGAGRDGPKPQAAPVKSPPVAPPPRSPKSGSGRIGNLGEWAHPAKKKRR